MDVRLLERVRNLITSVRHWSEWPDEANIGPTLLAVEAELVARQWQPIKTAPKEDGARFLVWCEGEPKIAQRTCRDAGRQVPHINFDFPAIDMITVTDAFGEAEMVDGIATHWMPLPEPPR